MPLTFEQLREILDGQGVAYWLSPDRPALLFGTGSKSGRRYMLTASLDGDGAFFQLRSFDYAFCRPDHRHFTPVARVLLELDYHYRGVKFSLDPRDGEIACFSDLMLFDADPTRTQVIALVGFFLDIIDTCRDRIQAVIDTGADPGEASDDDLV